MIARKGAALPAWAWTLLLVGCGPCRISTPDTQKPDTQDTTDTPPVDTGDSIPAWIDADGDGYSDYYDCDDGDPEVHPAAHEVCDERDNDCDGEVDEDRVCAEPLELGPSDALAVFYGAAAGDQAGQHCAGVGDVSGDGVADLLLPSFGHDARGSDSGAAYLFLGPVSGEQGLESAFAWYLGEAADDNAGRTVGAAGDIDGDGSPDLLFGAPSSDNSAPNAGTIYLVFGPHLAGEHELAEADARIMGQAEGDWLGDAESLGDMNQDGFGDLIIASQYDRSVGDDAGVAYVVYGPISGDLTLSDADVRLTGEAPDDQAGSTAVSVGDVNADGFPDLLVGARMADLGGRDSGAAYLFLGPVTASASLADADEIIPGSVPGSLLGAGWSFSAAGDHDADGLDDFLVGARGDTTVGENAGAAWLVLGTDLRELDYLVEASASFSAESAGDMAGTSVTGVADLNADGYTELAIGASSAAGIDADDAGAAYLFFGRAQGSYSLGDADVIARGQAADDMAGWSVEDAGAVGGGGVGGLLVGALGNDSAGDDAGAIYLFGIEEEG